MTVAAPLATYPAPQDTSVVAPNAGSTEDIHPSSTATITQARAAQPSAVKKNQVIPQASSTSVQTKSQAPGLFQGSAALPDTSPSDAEPTEPGDVLLYTKELKKVYDGRAVVNGVDIEVRRGEIVGLLGPNGAGKTTSFYMIVGLVRPNGGRVFFDGVETTNEPMYKRARMGMGYLPQEESIFRKLTVRENILAVMETQDFSPAERESQCQQLLEKFGIDHVANNLALTLSGGEKRRLTIARSLVTEPKLIMLDEPFSGVDPLAVEDIQKIILMLKRVGLAILITDHNVRETLGIVDRAYLIHEGRVLLQGTREYIVNHPLARERYLGENFSM